MRRMLSGAEMASYVGACVERACMQAAICMNGFFPDHFLRSIYIGWGSCAPMMCG